jgi:hypothetical protein
MPPRVLTPEEITQQVSAVEPLSFDEIERGAAPPPAPAPAQVPATPTAPAAPEPLAPKADAPVPPKPSEAESAPAPLSEQELRDFTKQLWQAGVSATIPEFKDAPARLRPPMTWGETVDKVATELGYDPQEFEDRLAQMQYPAKQAWEKATRRDRPKADEFIDVVKSAGGLKPLPQLREEDIDKNREVDIVGDQAMLFSNDAEYDANVAKEGELGYMVAQEQIRRALKDESMVEWVDYLNTNQMVTIAEIDEAAREATEDAGLTPEDREEWTKRYQWEAKRHRDLAIAWRTVNSNAGPVRLNAFHFSDSYLPVPEQFRLADDAWEKGEYGEWLTRVAGATQTALTPNVEVLGYSRDNNRLTAVSESNLEYGLNMADIPQAALTGMVTHTVNSIANGELPFGPGRKSMIRAQVEGVAGRDNLVELGGKAGRTATGGAGGEILGTVAAFPLAVVFPDLFAGLASAVKGGTKVMKTIAKVAGVSRDARVETMANTVETVHVATVKGDFAKANELEASLRRDPKLGDAIGPWIDRNTAAAARVVDEAEPESILFDAKWEPTFFGGVEGNEVIDDFMSTRYWNHRSLQKRIFKTTGQQTKVGSTLDISRTNDIAWKEKVLDDIFEAIDTGNYKIAEEPLRRHLSDKFTKPLVDMYRQQGGSDTDSFKAAASELFDVMSKGVNAAVDQKRVDELWDTLTSNLDDRFVRQYEAAKVEVDRLVKIQNDKFNAKQDVVEALAEVELEIYNTKWIIKDQKQIERMRDVHEKRKATKKTKAQKKTDKLKPAKTAEVRKQSESTEGVKADSKSKLTSAQRWDKWLEGQPDSTLEDTVYMLAGPSDADLVRARSFVDRLKVTVKDAIEGDVPVKVPSNWEASLDAAVEAIALVGNEGLDAINFAFKSAHGMVGGSFKFATNVISIYDRMLQQPKAAVGSVIVHELWHAMTPWIPASDLKSMYKEYITARMLRSKGTLKRQIELADMVSSFASAPVSSAGYRLKTFDEWIAEQLTALTLSKMTEGPSALPSSHPWRENRWLEALYRLAMRAYELVANKLGYNATERFFVKWLQSKNELPITAWQSAERSISDMSKGKAYLAEHDLIRKVSSDPASYKEGYNRENIKRIVDDFVDGFDELGIDAPNRDDLFTYIKEDKSKRKSIGQLQGKLKRLETQRIKLSERVRVAQKEANLAKKAAEKFAKKVAQMQKTASIELKQIRKMRDMQNDIAKEVEAVKRIAPEGALQDWQRMKDAVELQKKAYRHGLELTIAQLRKDARVLVQPVGKLKTVSDTRIDQYESGSFAASLEESMRRSAAARKVDTYGEMAAHMIANGQDTVKIDGDEVAVTGDVLKQAVVDGDSIQMTKPMFGEIDITPDAVARINLTLKERKLIELSKRAPKTPTLTAGETIEQDKLSDLLDHIVNYRTTKDEGAKSYTQSIAQLAHGIMFGGRPHEELADIAAPFKPLYTRMSRAVESSVGDAAALLLRGEKDLPTFYRYLDGETSLHTATGVPLTSAGYVDAIGITRAYMWRKIDSLDDAERDIVMQVLNATNIGEDIHIDLVHASKETQKKYQNAMEKLFGDVKTAKDEQEVDLVFGGRFFTDLKRGVLNTNTPGPFDHRDARVLRALLKAGDNEPPGKRAKMVLDEIEATYGVHGGASRQAGMLLVAHAAGHRAAMEAVNVGAVFTEKQRKAYERFLGGVHLEGDEVHIAQDVVNSIGLVNTLVGVNINGQRMGIPRGAQVLLDKAISRGLNPDIKATGSASNAKLLNQDTLDAAVNRFKRTMVRGLVFAKTKYFTLSTADIFDLTFNQAGLKPAINAITRASTQNALAAPFVANFVAAAGKAENKWKAWKQSPAGIHMRERARQSLQAIGDKLAQGIALSRHKIEVNTVLRGDSTIIKTPTGEYTGNEILNVANEEGVTSTFGTQLLADAISRAVFDKSRKDLATLKPGDLSLSSEAQKMLPLRAAQRVASAASENYRELEAVVDELAEAFDVRSRIGVMISLMQEGLDPRSAARLTVEMHYDFAGSISSFDRKYLIQLMFPYWAFQKNANRQFLDVITTPMGAYRMGVSRRLRSYGVQSAQQIIDAATTDPYGVDPDAFESDTQRDAYYAFIEDREREYGGYMNMPDIEKARIRMIFKGVSSGMAQTIDGRMYRAKTVGTGAMQLYDWSREEMKFYQGLAQRPSETPTPSYLANKDTVKFGGSVTDPQQRARMMARGDMVTGMLMMPDTSAQAAAEHMSAVAMFTLTLAEIVGVELAQAGISQIEGKPVYIDKGTARMRMLPKKTADTFDVSRAPVVGALARATVGLQTEATRGDYVKLDPITGWALHATMPMVVDYQQPKDEFDKGTYRVHVNTMEMLRAIPAMHDLMNINRSMSSASKAGFMSAEMAAASIAMMGIPYTEVEGGDLATREVDRVTRSSPGVPDE